MVIEIVKDKSRGVAKLAKRVKLTFDRDGQQPKEFEFTIGPVVSSPIPVDLMWVSRYKESARSAIDRDDTDGAAIIIQALRDRKVRHQNGLKAASFRRLPAWREKAHEMNAAYEKRSEGFSLRSRARKIAHEVGKKPRTVYDEIASPKNREQYPKLYHT